MDWTVSINDSESLSKWYPSSTAARTWQSNIFQKPAAETCIVGGLFWGRPTVDRELIFSRSSGATCICRYSFMTPSKVYWKPQARGHKREGGARRIRTDASRSRSTVEGADEACAGSEEERDVTAGEECPRVWWCRIAVRLTLCVRSKSALRSLMYLGMDWM